MEIEASQLYEALNHSNQHAPAKRTYAMVDSAYNRRLKLRGISYEKPLFGVEK